MSRRKTLCDRCRDADRMLAEQRIADIQAQGEARLRALEIEVVFFATDLFSLGCPRTRVTDEVRALATRYGVSITRADELVEIVRRDRRWPDRMLMGRAS